MIMKCVDMVDMDVVNMDGCEWRIITCNSEMETTPANTSSRADNKWSSSA